MIKFKNITGDSFLAVGTIQRKFALNGEKSLSGVLYDGDDVLNNIDKGWSLEFDGEPYVVTYFERNDNDNMLSFDAVHKFFWNMSKSVLYSETSGSHTISWYLDQIFANTGYTYALNFKPKAVSKDNWGMKTKLALFNDIISSISGEFEINGTLISIFEKVGSDLSTIVRYGFNLSDMSIENDAAGFVTYGEGFGAYEDQQNQSGPRLHTTYTSPLASVYGILQAEPVDDQRYTIESSLKDAIKAKVDASFSVSIKLSLYDLTAAGYPYKMAHVGDWLMAIDERLDFKQRIRIISVDDEFDVNGNRISYTVTAGNVGVVQKYQEANASLATQVNNALETANKASDDANIALISASGKNTSYYVDSFDMLPTTANEGDLGWVQSGDGRVLYIYTKKPDGTFYWEKRIDPEMQEQIEAGVDKAVSDAQKYSDQLVADNAEQVYRTLEDVQAKAQEYANKALEDAKADVQKTSQELVTSIQKEAADRATAVAELDNKAKDYADKAKRDAISAATTADDVINKKIDETASSITRTISQNKADADGKISTAQTTATQALNEVSTKVSKTEYDTKTGQLQTDLNQTTATANQAKTDIVSIKQKNDSQDTRMTTIENDANGTKTTVSSLQTTQGQQASAITTLQQRANGFDATVTKVNNIAVGGRNLVLNSGAPRTGVGSNTDNTGQAVFNYTLANGDSVDTLYRRFGEGTPITISFDWAITGDTISGTFYPQWNAQPWGIGASVARGIVVSSTNTSGHYTWCSTVPAFWSGKSAKVITLRMDYLQGTLTLSNFKFEQGNLPTAWSPAPEDLEGATAKAQLTADNASTTIGSYKTTNDGRVSRAEANITANANAISQKVSQSDYNAKTGQIDSQISSINQKANEITQSVANVQTKVDGMKVGGRNYIKNSDMVVRSGDAYQGDLISTVPTSTFSNQSLVLSVQLDYDNITEVIAQKRLGVELVFTDSNGGDRYEGAWATPNVGDSFHGRIHKVIQLPNVRDNADNSFRQGMYVQGITGTNIVVSKPKLEIGTTPTDFSPAPEDVETKIAAQKITVDGITQTVSSVQNKVNGLSVGGRNLFIDSKALRRSDMTPNGATLTIENYDESTRMLHLVAPQTPGYALGMYMYAYGNNHGIKEGDAWSFSADVKGVGVPNIFGIETGSHTPYSGTISANSWSRISQTGVAGSGRSLVLYFNTHNSPVDIYVKLPKLELGNMPTDWTPAPEDVDSNIAIQQINTLTQAKDFTTSSISNSEIGMRSQFTQTADAILANIGAVNLFPNSEFISDYGYAVKNGTVELSRGRKDNIDGRLSGTVTVVSTATAYQGYWARNIPVYGGHNYSASVLVHYENNNVANGAAYLDIWYIDNDGNRISRGDNVTGTSGYNGQGNSAYWVKLTYQGKAPVGAAWLQVNLLVNNAGAGQKAVFTQPMVTATEKLQPYTPNNDITTQLALLKDNWSIGIADNAGKLASGVFGDINGMTLNGKTVTINANQTVITGTAWINSAMIANGQIGTVQIGDAAITNAKIASLDVNKITGNISNWVLSQWTSATGNKVTIDGNGLYFSPGTSRMTTHGFEAWRKDSNAGNGYAAMGMLGSYAWETNSNINGVGLFAKFNGVPHDDPGSPYRGEIWGGDTIAIGALEPQIGHGYGYVTPYMIFPANDGVGNMYYSGNNSDTIIMSRWLSIYTGLNMRGHSIVNSSGYSLKENFRGVTGAEALAVFDNTDIMTYDYKPDSEDMDEMTEANRRNKVGFVINDNGQSPFRTDQRLVRYGNTRDDSVTVGYLMAAVKELNAQIKELKAQLGK